MKKFLKQILTITLSVMMILAAIPVQAAAPSYLTKSKTITLYTGKTARLMMYQKTWLGFFASGVDKVKSVKTAIHLLRKYQQNMEVSMQLRRKREKP